MTTTDADHVVVDTDVLLAASDAGRATFGAARTIFNDWPADGTTLYTSGQILREYLCVATRPVDRNGLGMSLADATANCRAFGARMRFLPENDKVHSRLLELIEDTACSGKQVHDANIAATMLVHGVGTVVTSNVSDFKRFERLIRVVGL
ncbi:PIN domain-containing protein [Nocardia yunnanensis]|uniref:PIN domain-containing protein n=1 Tax=Nocardia yunnanensis TaxID=2382165 RepID=A0A386ZC48_9NOCA|nr:type II toxin-antitoxin system VapC family toxin [Nocardia yunnanensis]AYF74069.1 PIN domain-containing protein [Nocardia yunnanensis]